MSLFGTILLEFLLISSSIIFLFKYRNMLGLAPLYIFLGSIQYLQANLGSSFSLKLFEVYQIHPGSIILFSAVLFAILLIYIKEGVASARALIIGIIVSNIIMTLMFEIVFYQNQIGNINSPLDYDGYFNQNFKYFLFGTVILLVDFLLIVIIYQYLILKFKKTSFLVLFTSLFTVLIFDAFVFNFFLFYGQEAFNTSLISHLIGKSISAFVYTILLYLYLKYIDKEKLNSAVFIANQDRDIFSIIKYRQRYFNLKIEKERAEHKIINKFRDNLNQITDGFVSLDANWCYTYLNKNAADFLGKTPESLIGKHIWTEFPEGKNLPVYKEYQRAFKTQETVHFEDYYEPLGIWYENRVYPSPEGLTIYFTDITEKKKASINNQMLLSLIETSDDFVGLATLEGKPLYLNLNGRRLVGLAEREQLPNIITDFFPEKYKDKIVNERIPKIHKENKWKGEVEFKHFLSGDLIPIEMSGFIIRDTNTNKPMALGIVASNISERKKAEQDLIKSESLFRELTSNTPVGIFKMSLDGTCNFVNKELMKYAEFTFEEAMGFGWTYAIHPEDRDSVLNGWMRALEAKQDYNVELRFLSNNGKVTWVSVSAVRTYDANNELDGYIGMCLDISQQKMTEQSLIKSESLFRRLTSEAPVAIYQADKDGNCNYVNKEWIRYTGQNFEEALGVGWLDVIHPDDKQKTLKEWKSLVKSGHDFSFVFRHLGSNGNVSWISSKAVRTYDANNLFNGFIGISVDITDSKKAEEIEIKNKQYLNNIINNIGDPVFVKDDQSRMILVNNALCDIFNLTRENILGKTLAENVPPEERERFLQNDKQVIKTGIESITEETVSLNKAETRTISTKKTRFIDNNGNKFIIGVIRDITETKKAEEKIKESEQYLDNIINNIGDPVFVKDHQSQIILANDAFCSILGVNRNEIIGKTLAENIPPEERESFLSIDREVISSGKENVNEENFTFSKNETRIISTKKTRFVDNKGNRFLIGVIRDITEQKKVSEEIRKAHQRITTHLNNSPLAIIEWDKNLIIRNWSAKAKSIFGWDEHEVIGKHFSDINLIYKEDAESTKIICDELMSGKVKSNRSVNRNNTKLKKVIYCDWYNSVLLSKDGEIETIFSLVQDITTRIETEKIIKESEEKFSKVFQSNIIGFSIVNSDQIRVDVNETMAKMLETTKKHLIGKTLEEAQIEILDDTYYEQKKILSEKIVEKGFLSNETVSRTLISGKKIVTLVSVEPLEVNGSLHLLTAAIDITDKKQAELELENYRNKLEELVELRTAELEKEKIKAQSADLMKSAFLATMSHELRTPMNSIIGFTGILLKEFAGPLNEEQKKQLGMVKNSSQHLLGLINDVLDISKIEAGKLKISLSPFNYLTTLEKTIDFILPQATKKGLTINTEIAAVNITLNSDERRVEQVLLNLLSNAIKFSNKGNVLVKVNIENNFVVTQVIDQGIGISKKDIDKLFIPFVQLDGGLNRVHEGSGLGLSICKNLLEKLGGSIQVESKKDKGSNFMFKIPI